MRGFSAHAAEPQEAVSIPAENLKRALDDYIRQTGIELIYNTDDVRAGVSHEVRGLAAEKALMEMLVNTGMSAIRDSTGAIIIA
ncbi:MAG: TonB-dependent receptor, partial [Alphaproteobacteria bacterium]|nr:TonB-dependent receptor [Alphaproteobacteria bacterium]